MYTRTQSSYSSLSPILFLFFLRSTMSSFCGNNFFSGFFARLNTRQSKIYQAKRTRSDMTFAILFYNISLYFSAVRNQFRQVVFHCAYRIDVHRWMEWNLARDSVTHKMFGYFMWIFSVSFSSSKPNQNRAHTITSSRIYLHRNIKGANSGCWHSIFFGVVI